MISAAQVRALQTLCGRVFGGEADPRAARLAWVTAQLGREVASFKELRFDEAGQLIQSLKTSLGQPLMPPRRRPSRELAMALGTAGRRGFASAIEMMAGSDDLAAIHELRQRVGMSEESFANWLGSSRSSPTRGRRELRTLADINRCRWALKSMLRRVG